MASEVRVETAEQMLSYIDEIMNQHLMVREAHNEQVLTRQDMRALEYAFLHEEPKMGDLSKFMQVAPSRVTALIDSLVARGLVKRVKSEIDRRASVIVLTNDGSEVTAAYRDRKRTMCKKLLSHLSPEEQLIFLKLLGKATHPLIQQ